MGQVPDAPGCVRGGKQEAVFILMIMLCSNNINYIKIVFYICEIKRHLVDGCFRNIEVRPDVHIFSRYG